MSGLAKACLEFEGCRVPLCPLDESLYNGALWYPDDPICSLKEFRNLDFIKKQRKLARAGRKGFFTFEMLLALGHKPADGVNPDSKQTIETWMKGRKRVE